MKIKQLIKELNKYDENQEVAIYNRSSGSALWIPNYDLTSTVAVDAEFAKGFELPEDTVFITGK